mgnify:CR=1 FL=1
MTEQEEVKVIENSILDDTKKALGILPSIKDFDVDIILQINSAFSILTQLGVGPDDGFIIKDNTTLWTEYYTDKRMSMIESYIHAKVKLTFDPPSNSFTVQALEKSIDQYEWRLKTLIETSGKNV